MVNREHVPQYKVMRENGLMTSHISLPEAEKVAAAYLKSFTRSFACIYKLHSVQSVEVSVKTETIGAENENYVLPFEQSNEASRATLRESQGQVIAGEGEYQGCRK